MPSKIVGRFIDPNYPGSITYRCRQQRNEEFKRRFPDLPEMRVLDLGGTAVSWQTLGLRAKSVTLVNLDHVEDPEEPWMEIQRTDACAGGFGKYDLVFSNSLLEHLGGHARRRAVRGSGKGIGTIMVDTDSLSLLSDRAALGVSRLSVPAIPGSPGDMSALEHGTCTRPEGRDRSRGTCRLHRTGLSRRDAELLPGKRDLVRADRRRAEVTRGHQGHGLKAGALIDRRDMVSALRQPSQPLLAGAARRRRPSC